MEKTDLVVSKLDSARRALIEAKTVQETKVVMDLAAAAEVYARRQQLGEEAIRYATEIKFDAMRKLGSILKVTPKNEGGRPAETGAQREQVLVPSLKTLGISRHVSSFAQQLAIVPQEEFDRATRGSNPRQRLNALIRKAERRERIERVDIEEAETIAGLKGDEVVALLREEGWTLIVGPTPAGLQIDELNKEVDKGDWFERERAAIKELREKADSAGKEAERLLAQSRRLNAQADRREELYKKQRRKTIEAKHGKVRIGTKSYVVKISDPELLSKLEDEIDPYRAGMMLARKLNTPAVHTTEWGFGKSAQMAEVCRIADKLREELIEIEPKLPRG